MRVAEGVYQRIDHRTGKPVPAKFEFVYRDGTGRQVWQTGSGGTKASAKAERAEILARLRLGQRIERTQVTPIEAANLWLERGTGQRGRWADSTRDRYERIVRLHIEQSADSTPQPIGQVKLRDLTPDRVAAWSQANERALAPTTAVIALATLSLVCRYAVRRGWIADNPVATLEPGEKPRWNPQGVGILDGDDLTTLLAHAGTYRFLFEFLAYTGLRIGEALGLCWADIDFDNGLIHVHRQLSRKRLHAPLKTEAGKRHVILSPGIAKLLREQWLASAHKKPTDLVFANTVGRGRDYRDVGEAFRRAIKSAEIAHGGKRLSLHSYASLLIANGLNVVFVSRQLGHANPSITLNTYAHLFAQADHADTAREPLEANYHATTRSAGSVEHAFVVTALVTPVPR